MALTYTPDPELGKPCPDFQLPAVDGKTYSLNQLKNGKPLVVMFICNHCPYVKAVEDRLIELAKDLKTYEIQTVAICSNDSAAYPDDSFENLQKRAQQKEYPFLYLHDATQSVAKAFGAVCTPDFFVYDAGLTLRYRGRLDDSWKEPEKATRRELFDATLGIFRGMKEIKNQKPSMGCSIKWKD